MMNILVRFLYWILVVVIITSIVNLLGYMVDMAKEGVKLNKTKRKYMEQKIKSEKGK